MKRCLFLIALCCVVLAGCGTHNEAVREHAQAVADAFSEGNIRAINEVVFGTDELVVDDELSNIQNDEKRAQGGILAAIFKHVTVRVSKVTDNTIDYEVEAPNMSGVFDELDRNEADMKEEELLEYMKSYVRSAKTKKTNLSLEYVFEEDRLIVNYRDERFINAITGDLFDAYKKLYSKMMGEYAKELGRE